MSSNYPPGVTGRERQIAGDIERVMNRLCVNDTYDVVQAHRLLDFLPLEDAHPGGDPAMFIEEIRAWIIENQYEEAEGEECGFDGDVDCVIDPVGYGVVTISWTCPWCGSEHEDEEGPDDE